VRSDRRVESIPQLIAQEVEGQHRQEDRKAWEENEVGVELEGGPPFSGEAAPTCLRGGDPQPERVYASQSVNRNPGIRAKSFVLWVTSVASWARAIAAIQASVSPVGHPS